MATVTVEEFHQYMRQLDVDGKVGSANQAIAEIRTQLAAMNTAFEDRVKLMNANVDVRLGNMQTSGNQLISDVQVASDDVSGSVSSSRRS